MNTRLIAAAVAISLSVGALLAGDERPPASSVAGRQLIAAEIEREADHVTALELAAWIRERRPGLRVIDVRPDSEFQQYHVPTAERMSLREVATARFGVGETIVMYSEGGAHAAQAWVLLRGAGTRNAYFLRGGILEWLDEVMQPMRSTELTRYFGGVARPAPAVPSLVPLPSGVAESVRRQRRRSC
jgi:rhodanese-related sulfurtransferase